MYLYALRSHCHNCIPLYIWRIVLQKYLVGCDFCFLISVVLNISLSSMTVASKKFTFFRNAGLQNYFSNAKLLDDI